MFKHDAEIEMFEIDSQTIGAIMYCRKCKKLCAISCRKDDMAKALEEESCIVADQSK